MLVTRTTGHPELMQSSRLGLGTPHCEFVDPRETHSRVLTETPRYWPPQVHEGTDTPPWTLHYALPPGDVRSSAPAPPTTR